MAVGAVDPERAAGSGVLVVGDGALAECYARLIGSAGQATDVVPDVDAALAGDHSPGAVLLTTLETGADVERLAARWPDARLVQIGGDARAGSPAIDVPADSSPVFLFAALRVRRSGRRASARRTTRSPLWRLTDRELRVLRELLDGRSTAQIAAALRISPHTARTHANNVVRKLGVSSRLEAAAVGRQAGLRNRPAAELDALALDAPALDAPALDAPALDALALDALALDALALETDAPEAVA